MNNVTGETQREGEKQKTAGEKQSAGAAHSFHFTSPPTEDQS